MSKLKHDITKEQKVQAAWMRGLLSYKLDGHQLPIHKALWDAINQKYDTYTVNCSRQLGKSFTLLVVAFEYCLRHKNAQVRFAIPIASTYEEMYGLSLSTIMEDCPEAMRPDHQTSKKIIYFKNGSHIKFAGTDGTNYVNLRGSMSHLNIIDEASFCDNLEEVVEQVLKPQTTRTGGLTIFCSTPPVQMDHPYVKYYFEDKARKRMQEYTIYANTALEPERIEEIKQNYIRRGQESVWKREFLCEFIIDENMVIIKEWTKEVAEACTKVVDTTQIKHFNYMHKYEGMDLGVEDNTVDLFGFYDFENRHLHIQKELVKNGPALTTPDLADDIKKIEKELWGTLNPRENNPYRRIADSNNLQMLNDLRLVYSLPFIPVRKTKPAPGQPSDTKQSILNGMINKLRVMIAEGRISVDPSCEQLLGCLQYASWNKQKDKFAHSAMFGHFDALAALIYLVKMLDEYTNPIPNMLNIRPSTHYIPANAAKPQSETATVVATVFGGRRRL